MAQFRTNDIAGGGYKKKFNQLRVMSELNRRPPPVPTQIFEFETELPFQVIFTLVDYHLVATYVR